MPIARRAYEIWKELEDKSGKQLVHQTGGLDIGPRDDPDGIFANSLTACRIHNIPHQVLSHAEVNERFPGFELQDESLAAVYSPEAGLLDPEACICACVEVALSEGATVLAREEVIEWDSQDLNTVTVTTSKGSYQVRKLVVAVGPWSPSLLGAAFPISSTITVERQVMIQSS